ncbi:LapA family protein [Bradyrhizobium tropiciagri]|uniref:lipopolysaccharide assembly protein LapA domain-containing protein n=1 Tax=Bradyrhizobium tropiciagri TaxID=312253 RepID=UPI001BA545C2|nr:LapA family protein [Bradyrhizobium tropiciagri]MBR0871583.1 LapA family protein [Bradyrhizobium tropiciagri]
MRKFFTAVVLIPLGLIFIIFAVANRHWVTVSFDPFNSVTPAVAVTLPLFVVIIASAILGVIAGGVTTWLRQGRWRRAARRHEADARQARAEIADIRAAAARDDAKRRPAAAPAQLGFYGSAGRDKQGATL